MSSEITSPETSGQKSPGQKSPEVVYLRNGSAPQRKKFPARIFSRRALLWLAGIGAAGFFAVGFLVPWIASRQIKELTDRKFDLGFLVIAPNGHVSISLAGEQAVNRGIHLDAGRARIDWWQAARKRLRIGYIELSDAQFEIEKLADGRMIINSVDMERVNQGLAEAQKGEGQKGDSQSPEAKNPEPSGAKQSGDPWGIGVGRVDLTNLKIRYKEPQLNVDLAVNRFTMGAAESWRPGRETPFEADLTVNGGKILLKGSVTPFSPNIVLKSNVNVTAFPIDWLNPLLASAGIREAAGHVGLKGDLASEFNKDAGAAKAEWTGSIRLDKVTALYQPPAPTKGGGKPNSPEQKMRLAVDGSIDIDDAKVSAADLNSEKGPVLTYAADSVKNGSAFWAEMRDESFRRPPVVRLDPLNFEVNNLDSQNPDGETSFKLDTSLGKYERVQLAGTLTPFARALNGKITASIKELNLTPFTAYAERFTGSRIQTGVFNLETKADIKNNLLAAKNNIQLKVLQFQYLNKEKEEEDTGKIGIPLNVVLSLLKDKNGDIKLDVPMDGPVQDPSMGIGPLMMKLAAKAATTVVEKAATNFFPPLKTAQTAYSVFKFATKWRFEPVVFNPGTLDMTEASKNYLAEVGAKLKERPQVRLNVCGFGTRQDLQGGQDLQRGQQKLPPFTQKEKDQLYKLSADRAAFIKDFLVGSGVESDRLLICSPDTEDKPDALPRGTLSL